MKKIVFILIVINIFLITLNAYSLDKNTCMGKYINCVIFVDNKEQSSKDKIINFNNKVYISLKEITDMTGYKVTWNKNKIEINNSIFDGTLSEERNLTIQKGIKYKFLGTEMHGEFKLDNFIKEGDFVYISNPTVKVIAKTPYEVATKLAQIKIFGDFYNGMVIEVRYDKNTDSWIVYDYDNKKKKSHNIISEINFFYKISRTDGTVVSYSKGKL